MNGFRRTLTNVSTLSAFNISYKKTLGHKFRDTIAKCGHYLKPIKKRLFPNFIVAHYAYIIFMAIFCSILMYPVHDAKYIDILFLATGAATQGGLNTIDVNSLTLYQQLVIYLTCCLCTPIVIHGFLAFVRLYWFERYFDDIKNTSKRNFKMRRTRTILQREMTRRSFHTNAANHPNSTYHENGSSNHRKGYHQNKSSNGIMNTHNDVEPFDGKYLDESSKAVNSSDADFQEKLFSGQKINRDEQSIESNNSEWMSSNTVNDSMNLQNSNDNSPNDSDISEENSNNYTNNNSNNNSVPGDGRSPSGERFAKRRKSADIKPADMYRSIMMLRGQQQLEQHDEADEEGADGPALVIKGRNIEPVEKRKAKHSKPSGDYASSISQEVESPEFDNSVFESDASEQEYSNISDERATKNSSNNDHPTASRDVEATLESGDSGDNGDDNYSPSDDDDEEEGASSVINHSSNIRGNGSNEEDNSLIESGDSTSHTESRPLEQNTFGSTINGSTGQNDFSSSNNSSVDMNSSSEIDSVVESSPNDAIDRVNNQHITFASFPASNSERNPLSNRNHNIHFDESGNNRRGSQTIHFDIGDRPSKRNYRNRSKGRHAGSQSLNLGQSSSGQQKSSRSSIFRHLKKGKRLRQNIKQRLYTSPQNISVDGVNEVTSRSPHADQSDSRALDHDVHDNNNDMEDYFADNETDDDIPVDVSPQRLNELAKTPDFQKMVYKNWKANNKKRRKSRRKSWIFDNDGAAQHYGNAYHRHQKGTYKEMSSLDSELDDETSERPSDIQSSQSNSSNESDSNNSRYNFDSNGSNINIDPEDQAGYYGLNFDYESPHNMNLPLSRTMSTNYLSWQPTIGRNSTFVGLTKTQRDELGGVEYRAIKLLCRILVVYYIGFHIMSFVMMVPWICIKKHYIHVVREDGVSPAWWGFFTAASAFNDLGLTLTPDSMSSFCEAIYPLIVMMWFIIIGNTGFPVLLRWIIYVMFRLSPDLSQMKESLGFLLDHPRRCFTLLFPSAATWWLLLTLLFLNITDLILFVILDLGSAVLKPFSRGNRVLMGLFQAVSTRTAGFSVVDLSKLHSAIQVSYMLMMYVSVLPLAISIRRTNVYEEQSLGLYGKMNDEELEEEANIADSDSSEYDDNNTVDSEVGSSEEGSSQRNSINNEGSEAPRNRNGKSKRKAKAKNKARHRGNDEETSTRSFIGAHVRKQLSFDLWFLFLGLFIICICENRKIKDTTRPDFNIFSILFEIVSAYGTVGLSLGYPNTNQSFSSQFTVLSKLVIIAMLVRGRCRGLPYSLDRAIILPSQRMEQMDHIEDLKLRRNKANTADNIDPVTEYVKNSSGWLRRKVRNFSHFYRNNSSSSVDRSQESMPFTAEYEMETNPK